MIFYLLDGNLLKICFTFWVFRYIILKCQEVVTPDKKDNGRYKKGLFSALESRFFCNWAGSAHYRLEQEINLFYSAKGVIKKMVKENSYINIQAFMVNDLQLKGNELLVYAIIHGFSQDGESEFTGSLQYLADWTKSTKQGIIKVLQSLCEKQLLIKNVEYKNNIRFCTYRARVLNKVEQCIKQSLIGYSTEFNGGIKQSLPNNINNNIYNNLEDTKESEPVYIPKITTENYQNLQTECFNLISEHNKSGVKKLAVSRDLFSFAQKEGRELVQLANIESPENIIKALKNYLSVLSVDTWKTYFSFSEFVKKYTEYLPEYFNIQNYIKSVKNPDELADAFYAEMMKDIDNNNFDVALFYEHKQEWLDRGRPKGKAYFELQNEWYKQGGIND